MLLLEPFISNLGGCSRYDGAGNLMSFGLLFDRSNCTGNCVDLRSVMLILIRLIGEKQDVEYDLLSERIFVQTRLAWCGVLLSLP